LTTSDMEQRALKLLEKEDRRNEKIAARRSQQEKEGRLQGAIKRIKENDQRQREAQSKREAEDRAAELSHRRYELAEELEAGVANIDRLLSEYQSVHGKQLAALRDAGRSVDGSFHGSTLTDLLTQWFRHRFGGWNSITGTPAPFHGLQDLPLPERDDLASPGSKTEGAA
jgi:hypothetical protein